MEGIEIMPKMRLDFIFASESLLSMSGDLAQRIVLADTGIQDDEVTDVLSDHFPVHATWKYALS